MTTPDLLTEILGRLGEVGVRCPEFRFGQLIAAICTLAEDDTESSLWDIGDADFLAALDRFAADIAVRRGGIASSPASIVSQPPRQVGQLVRLR